MVDEVQSYQNKLDPVLLTEDVLLGGSGVSRRQAVQIGTKHNQARKDR